jgi:hypothetical protein
VLKRHLWILLTVALLTAGVAAASASSLRGTYRTTITGKPAALNGNWRLEFLSGSTVHLVRNRKLGVVSKATQLAGKRLRFSDRSGSYACSPTEGKGTYTYRLSGRRLTFAAVADKCIGRRLVLTTKPFVK